MRRHTQPGDVAPVENRGPDPGIVAAFRGEDGSICHGRCGQPLSLQGVRAMLEADFYCYPCLVHVTLPLFVIDGLPRATPAETIAR